MTNDWIIDVLLDLKKFSAKNSMDDLAEHLNDTITVATAELMPQGSTGPRMAGEVEQARRYARDAISGNNA